jgi:hypothetical protein
MRVCIIFAEWGVSAPPRQSELHSATIRGARLSFMSRPEHEGRIPWRSESYMAKAWTSSIVEECILLSILVYFIWIQRGQTNEYLHTMQTGNLYLPESRAKSTFLLLQQLPESLQQVPIVLMARLKPPLPSVSIWYPTESIQPILALHSGQQSSSLTIEVKFNPHFLASLNNR